MSPGKRSAKDGGELQILSTFDCDAILRGAPCLVMSAPATAEGLRLAFQSEHKGSTCPLGLSHPFSPCLSWERDHLSAYSMPAGSTEHSLSPAQIVGEKTDSDRPNDLPKSHSWEVRWPSPQTSLHPICHHHTGSCTFTLSVCKILPMCLPGVDFYLFLFGWLG